METERERIVKIEEKSGEDRIKARTSFGQSCEFIISKDERDLDEDRKVVCNLQLDSIYKSSNTFDGAADRVIEFLTQTIKDVESLKNKSKDIYSAFTK